MNVSPLALDSGRRLRDGDRRTGRLLTAAPFNRPVKVLARGFSDSLISHPLLGLAECLEDEFGVPRVVGSDRRCRDLEVRGVVLWLSDSVLDVESEALGFPV